METVLLVDDERDVRELARDCLVAAGYRVIEAGDGEEALQIAAASTEPIHLLLTGVVMPRLNGVELARRLTRQRPPARRSDLAQAVQPRGADPEDSGGL